MSIENSSDSDLSQTEEIFDSKQLQILANKIKPAKSKSKKGKKFADKDLMLSLVDVVNAEQEQKIKAKLEKDGEILKRLASRERNKSKAKKDDKKEKLARLKEQLKSKKRGVKGGKGDHRKFDEKDNDSAKRKVRNGKGIEANLEKAKVKSSSKKRVSFK